MSGMISTLVMVGVLAAVGWFAWTNKDEILNAFKPAAAAAAPASAPAAADDSGGGDAASEGTYDPKTGKYTAPKGGYKAPAGGYKATGGYKGMPGWYTAAGHHHCIKGEKGCVCTDPKKCLGIRGTGSENCKGGVCAPGPGECRPDLGRYGAGPCNDCPPGTGGGKCTGGVYKAKYARAFYAAGNPALNIASNNMTALRDGYYDIVPTGNGGYTYDPTSFAVSNEKMSYF